MTVPATEGWFSVSIRRNRRSFFLASIWLWLILAGVVAFIYFTEPTRSWAVFMLLAFFVPAAICSWCLTGQRLRDMGLTGWLALLWIPVNVADPFVGGAASLAFIIVLICVPGTKGPNRYGPDPLERGYPT